ncbi:hypothetical protein P4O66_013247 [Electrophorus voltai]|uniref:Uncharacterized protein n=1 Tax=Electrophorus voltai TaxID=2609070 RepID=A0AAD8Z2D2_9TELE|nr:hypothetical protein P4O66_013247 [Electrophorus voltai]
MGHQPYRLPGLICAISRQAVRFSCVCSGNSATFRRLCKRGFAIRRQILRIISPKTKLKQFLFRECLDEETFVFVQLHRSLETVIMQTVTARVTDSGRHARSLIICLHGQQLRNVLQVALSTDESRNITAFYILILGHLATFPNTEFQSSSRITPDDTPSGISPVGGSSVGVLDFLELSCRGHVDCQMCAQRNIVQDVSDPSIAPKCSQSASNQSTLRIALDERIKMLIHTVTQARVSTRQQLPSGTALGAPVRDAEGSPEQREPRDQVRGLAQTLHLLPDGRDLDALPLELKKQLRSDEVDAASRVDRVIFCVFLETDYEIYKRKMSDFFSPGLCDCGYIMFDGAVVLKEAAFARTQDARVRALDCICSIQCLSLKWIGYNLKFQIQSMIQWPFDSVITKSDAKRGGGLEWQPRCRRYRFCQWLYVTHTSATAAHELVTAVTGASLSRYVSMVLRIKRVTNPKSSLDTRDKPVSMHDSEKLIYSHTDFRGSRDDVLSHVAMLGHAGNTETGDEQPTCEDMEKLSQGAADEDMEDVDTPNQTPENDVPGDENSKEKKEIPAEKNDPERETCTEEKIPAAHADQAQTEQERGRGNTTASGQPHGSL